MRVPFLLGWTDRGGLDYFERVGFLRHIRFRCRAMSDDGNPSALVDLVKAGCRPIGLHVHVERSKDRRLRLSRKFGRALTQLVQALHLFARQKIAGISPTFLASGRAYADESSADLQNVEFVAMLRGCNGLRGRRNFLAKI